MIQGSISSGCGLVKVTLYLCRRAWTMLRCGGVTGVMEEEPWVALWYERAGLLLDLDLTPSNIILVTTLHVLLVARPLMLLHQLAFPIAGQGRAKMERKSTDDSEDLATENVMLL